MNFGFSLSLPKNFLSYQKHTDHVIIDAVRHYAFMQMKIFY